MVSEPIELCIRAYLGMSPGDYLCNSIGSGSTTIIDHGEQDTELKTDSRPGQDSQILAMKGSDQGRIPNPRTGNAGAADLPTKNSQATSNDVFPKIKGARDPTILWGINIDFEHPTLFKKFGTELDGGASGQKLVVEPKEHLEVITYPLKIVVEVESDEIDGTQGVFTANRKNLFDVRMNLSEFLGISSAYKVFVEMPGLGMVERGTNVSSWIVELLLSIAAVIGKQKALDGNLVFD